MIRHHRPRRHRPSRPLGAVALAPGLALAGCGGDDAPAADREIASLGSTASTPEAAATETTLDFEAAIQAYNDCMREHGVEIDDALTVSDEAVGGGASAAGETERPDIDPDEFATAEAECAPLIEAAMSEVEMSPEDEAEMRRIGLEYAECMREHGVDMPDPEFSNGGMVIVQGDPATVMTAGPNMDEAVAACGDVMMQSSETPGGTADTGSE